MTKRTQLDLFAAAHARYSDPDTSHAAAASIPSERIRASQKAVLSLFQAAGCAFTDEELIDIYRDNRHDLPPQSESGIRTRRAELVRMGKLRDSGRRALTIANRKTIIWELAS